MSKIQAVILCTFSVLHASFQAIPYEERPAPRRSPVMFYVEETPVYPDKTDVCSPLLLDMALSGDKEASSILFNRMCQQSPCTAFLDSKPALKQKIVRLQK